MADEASDSPILDLLAGMNRAGIEASSLDAQSLMLVRLAALVAVDAPPVSYMLNLEMAGDVNVDAEAVEGMLAAIAPIVGSARVASAAGKMVRALGSRSASQSSTRPKPNAPVGGSGCAECCAVHPRRGPGEVEPSLLEPGRTVTRSGERVYPDTDAAQALETVAISAAASSPSPSAAITPSDPREQTLACWRSYCRASRDLLLGQRHPLRLGWPDRHARRNRAAPHLLRSGLSARCAAGMLITAAIVLVVSNIVDLSAIASVGSACSLLIFLLVGTAAFRLRTQIGARAVIVVTAIAATAVVLVFFAVDTLRNAPETFTAIVIIVILAVVLDLVWKRARGESQPNPEVSLTNG